MEEHSKPRQQQMQSTESVNRFHWGILLIEIRMYLGMCMEMKLENESGAGLYSRKKFIPHCFPDFSIITLDIANRIT